PGSALDGTRASADREGRGDEGGGVASAEGERRRGAVTQCLRSGPFVRARELHTLEVTGLKTVAQIKALVASLEGLNTEDKVVFLAGSPLQDEVTLGQCGVEALMTLEVVGHVLGGEWDYTGHAVPRGYSWS
ncbi:hypothetical protein MC885_021657, partial [Smutsia gigantea]